MSNYSQNTTKYCEYACLPYLCSVLQCLCPFFVKVCALALFFSLTPKVFIGVASHLPPFHTAHANSDANSSKCFPVVVTPPLLPVFALLMRQTAILELFRVLLPAFRTILGASFKFRRVLPVSLAARAQANGTRTKSL